MSGRQLRWKTLQTVGVPGLLRSAAEEIIKRGFTPHSIKLSWGGKVDLYGATALAAGVKFHQLGDDLDRVWKSAPEANQAKLLATWDFLDAALQMDPSDWQKVPGRDQAQVIGILLHLADLIDVVI